jgi:hypothetical protein
LSKKKIPGKKQKSQNNQEEMEKRSSGLVGCLVAALVFANTWQGDFVYDDRWVLHRRRHVFFLFIFACLFTL